MNPKYYLLVSNPSLRGSVVSLAMSRLDTILGTSVDEQKPMLKEDTIVVLVSYLFFFTNVKYLYVSIQLIFLELHKQQGESEFLL